MSSISDVRNYDEVMQQANEEFASGNMCSNCGSKPATGSVCEDCSLAPNHSGDL